MIPKIRGASFLSVCLTPNRQNILEYLRYRKVPQTVASIRFGLDSSHGCVWSPSQVQKTLDSLYQSGLIQRVRDEWVAVAEEALEP